MISKLRCNSFIAGNGDLIGSVHVGTVKPAVFWTP